MATKSMKVKFKSQVEDNEPQFFEANITVDYSIDNDYGADADDRRGVEALYINEIIVDSCIDEQANLVELPLNERMMDDIWQMVWEDFSE